MAGAYVPLRACRYPSPGESDRPQIFDLLPVGGVRDHRHALSLYWLATNYLHGLTTSEPDILRTFTEDGHQDVAIGICMSRAGLSQHEAREPLCRDAGGRGLPLGKFAQDVVQSYERDS